MQSDFDPLPSVPFVSSEVETLLRGFSTTLEANGFGVGK